MLRQNGMFGKVIDHGAVAADGIANAWKMGHLLRKGVQRAPGGNHNLDPGGNGCFQCHSIAGGQSGLLIQRGFVQIQGNELWGLQRHHSISFSACA